MELVTVLKIAKKMKYNILALLLCIIFLYSCQTIETKTKSDLQQYFKTLPVGTRVSKIEEELNLPPPLKMTAPAYGQIGWQFNYFLENKFYIYFNADYIGKDNLQERNNTKNYIFLGKYDIGVRSEP